MLSHHAAALAFEHLSNSLVLGVLMSLLRTLVLRPIGGEPQIAMDMMKRIAAGDLYVSVGAPEGSVKGLIGESVEKLRAGTGLEGESADALNAIMNSYTKVSGIVGEIATASKEQAAGIEQINMALSEINESTQQNAALVEQAAAPAKVWSITRSSSSPRSGFRRMVRDR